MFPNFIHEKKKYHQRFSTPPFISYLHMSKGQLTELYTCRDYESSSYYQVGYIIGKVLTWRSQILNINMIGYSRLKLYHFKPKTLKHVEIIGVSDKPTCFFPLESS